MRIIGGEAKGRQIYLPKGCQIRPTSDRIKEALFNILHPVDRKYFLDLFAGSGNIGIEALSRGAARVVFIERNLTLANVISRNVQNFGLSNRCEVLKMEIKRGIRELGARGEQFDILFADPPYEKGLIKKTLHHLEDRRLFSQGFTLVIQHSIRETLQDTLTDHYVLKDQRIYGDTALSLLKLNLSE